MPIQTSSSIPKTTRFLLFLSLCLRLLRIAVDDNDNDVLPHTAGPPYRRIVLVVVVVNLDDTW